MPAKKWGISSPLLLILISSRWLLTMYMITHFQSQGCVFRCMCLCERVVILGFPEADPKTKLWVPAAYLDSDPKKQWKGSAEVTREGKSIIEQVITWGKLGSIEPVESIRLTLFPPRCSSYHSISRPFHSWICLSPQDRHASLKACG